MSNSKRGKVIFTNNKLITQSDQYSVINTPVSWVEPYSNRRAYQAAKQLQLIKAGTLSGDVVVLCLENYPSYREVFRLACLEHDIEFEEVLDEC